MIIYCSIAYENYLLFANIEIILSYFVVNKEKLIPDMIPSTEIPVWNQPDSHTGGIIQHHNCDALWVFYCKILCGDVMIVFGSLLLQFWARMSGKGSTLPVRLVTHPTNLGRVPFTYNLIDTVNVRVSWAQSYI